jgi:hypothetical protein
MRPAVVVKDGRLVVKKGKPTAWKTVEIAKCDRCGVIAAWLHPDGGRRCVTCSRGQAPGWRPIVRLRCDLCNVIATWQHPAGRRRCNTCPRPER